MLLNERYFKALSDNSNKTIYEWDFTSGVLKILTDIQKLFDGNAYEVHSLEHALRLGIAYPEDIDKFMSMFEVTSKGQNFNNLKLRIKDKVGEYHWCNVSGISIPDSKGKPCRAIAFFEDIDEQIKKETELSVKATQDQLTGLYNNTCVS